MNKNNPDEHWAIIFLKTLGKFIWKRLTLPHGTIGYSGEIGSGYDRISEEDEIRLSIVKYARSQMGKPYKLGIENPLDSDDPSDWDCSELVEHSYFAGGKHIPDGSNYQFDFCRPIQKPIHADLGFLWSDKWQRIGHVMLYSGEGTLIHAIGGRGVVEDSTEQWENHPRFRGWRRHPDFSRSPEDRSMI